MKRRINLVWLIGLLLVIALAATAQDAKTSGAKANPMKKGDLIKALESNALPSKELIERIQQRGVDFELNEKNEIELKNAGANSDVITAIKANYKEAPKKKGLFDKMTEGVNKATSKAKETIEKTPASTVVPLLFPPVGVAVIAAQQAKKQKESKAETTGAGAASKENSTPESSAAKTGAGNKSVPAEKTVAPSSTTGTPTPPMVGGYPKIVGTGWKIIEIYSKGTKPKGGRTVVPTFVFCQSGRWEIVRYGLTPGNAGAVGQVGTYKVSGGEIITKNDTDGLIANYKMNWLAGENILELDEGSSVIMRLQYNGESQCKQ